MLLVLAFVRYSKKERYDMSTRNCVPQWGMILLKYKRYVENMV